MKMRYCVVPECSSNTANQPHLAYHKFPSCPDTKRIWLNRMKLDVSELRHHTPQVCSKHFRKDDYLPLHKTSKRMLKKGAVPSTFAWGSCDPVPSASELHQESSKHKHNVKPIASDGDAVESTPADDSAVTTVSDSGGLDDSFEDALRAKDAAYSKSSAVFKDPEVSLSKSMIESENSDHGSVTDTSSVSFTPEKNYGRSSKLGDCKYLSGDRLEAKDLSSNKWYKAKVVEVDWEDEEILIHFEKWSQRFDEWIPMDSSRLRPVQSHSPNNQSAFRVGETVMASWSDNRKYAARIKSILSNDKYEVLFFDGFCKVVKGHKISKGTEESLAMDPGLFHNAGPTTMTKAERRERKRKIGPVAELFQIKKKNSLEVEKIALKKKSSGTSDSDTTKDESLPGKIALTFDDKKRESDGKSRQRAFPVLKGFVDEDKSRIAGEKTRLPGERRTRHKPSSSSSIYDHPTAGSSKETTTIPKPTRAARRRKRDDNIDPSDYDNWEPEGEEAWLVESTAGLRRSLKVKDERLPSGWEKHTIQRKSGNSAGKWDVFLVSPKGRRFRSRKEMLSYFTDTGEEYKPELYDFTLRCNMRRKSTDTELVKFKKKSSSKDSKATKPPPATVPPPAEVDEMSAIESLPLPPSRRVKTLLPKSGDERGRAVSPPPPHPSYQRSTDTKEGSADEKVGLGHVAIQMENNALICPKDGCLKHFRKENLLQMHIKHYHPEYSKFMGSTPNVADLAYARTVGEPLDEIVPKARPFNASFFEQINRFEAQKKTKMLQAKQSAKSPPMPAPVVEAPPLEAVVVAVTETKVEPNKVVKILPPESPVPSPKPAEVLPIVDFLNDDKPINFEEYIKPIFVSAVPLASPKMPPAPKDIPATPVPGIKTLFPVVRTVAKIPPLELMEEDGLPSVSTPAAGARSANASPAPTSEPTLPSADLPPLSRSKVVKKRRLSDMYIETLKKRRLGKLTKCYDDSALNSKTPTLAAFSTQPQKYRYLKKKKISPMSPLTVLQPPSVPELSVEASDPDGSPGSVAPPLTEEETCEQLQKRDIINCTCGIMEEDGLMIQCDLCLCWQHVLCNNTDGEVPDKYVCVICLNPARERKSTHYLHDQYWLKDGVLPSLSCRTKDLAAIARREARLKRSHDLTGDLLGYKEVLHSLRVKLAIVEQSDHPKLYLWSEKPVSSTSNASDPSTDIKQELLDVKGDPAVVGATSQPIPDIKLEDLTKTDKLADLAAANEMLEAGSAMEVDIGPLHKEGGNEASLHRSGDHTKSNMNPTAVQDHTYVHLQPSGDESTKRGPASCASVQDKTPSDPDDSLKLDSHILAQALTSGGMTSGSGFGPDLGADTSALIAAGLNVNTSVNPSLSPSICTLDAATQNQLLQFPICRSELMRFANSMADNLKDAALEPTPLPTESLTPQAPQPEKPIDPLECRLNLLDQIEDFQDQLDARLALIEQQVTELEAEDPEPPSEETITFYPQTKHTLQMLNRDLATMKKLAVAASGYTVGKW